MTKLDKEIYTFINQLFAGYYSKEFIKKIEVCHSDYDRTIILTIPFKSDYELKLWISSPNIQTYWWNYYFFKDRKVCKIYYSVEDTKNESDIDGYIPITVNECWKFGNNMIEMLCPEKFKDSTEQKFVELFRDINQLTRQDGSIASLELNCNN